MSAAVPSCYKKSQLYIYVFLSYYDGLLILYPIDVFTMVLTLKNYTRQTVSHKMIKLKIKPSNSSEIMT